MSPPCVSTYFLVVRYRINFGVTNGTTSGSICGIRLSIAFGINSGIGFIINNIVFPKGPSLPIKRIIPPIPRGIADNNSGHIVSINSAKPSGVINLIIASKTAHCRWTSRFGSWRVLRPTHRRRCVRSRARWHRDDLHVLWQF